MTIQGPNCMKMRRQGYMSISLSPAARSCAGSRPAAVVLPADRRHSRLDTAMHHLAHAVSPWYDSAAVIGWAAVAVAVLGILVGLVTWRLGIPKKVVTWRSEVTPLLA